MEYWNVTILTESQASYPNKRTSPYEPYCSRQVWATPPKKKKARYFTHTVGIQCVTYITDDMGSLEDKR